MIDQLATQRLLESFRGEAPVDRVALAEILVGLGRVGAERPDVDSVDVNPLIVTPGGHADRRRRARRAGRRADGDAVAPMRADRPTAEQFRALFEPRGVLVAGASSHPGKFGFVVAAQPARQRLPRAPCSAPTCRARRSSASAPSPTSPTCPTAQIDLVFVCTPASANPGLLRACAAKGVKAAFLTSAGYGEAGEDGRRAEAELVALADELGILLAGPNGQGVVSTPVSLCAQIVAPYPPAGRIGVASQSGNFVSSFLNYARVTGVGISRAVSAGNAAAVSVADYLDHYADDDATAVGLAYVEGISDGRGLLDRLAGRPRAQAAGARQGRGHRGRRQGRGQPHRRAGRRRQGVRRRVPGRRHHAGGDGRGGVRGGGDVRHPARAGRARTSSC